MFLTKLHCRGAEFFFVHGVTFEKKKNISLNSVASGGFLSNL